MNKGKDYGKTIIVYLTKIGVTKENAFLIASILRDRYNLEVDMVNLRENPSPELNRYRNIVLGSGVRIQRVYKKALRFLKRSDLKGKRLAIFLSSLEGGDPRGHDDAVKKYIKNVLAKYPHLHTVAAEVFGGRMKILGFTIKDNRDKEKVRVWAEKLGKILSQ